jgi:hypothetical protein
MKRRSQAMPQERNAEPSALLQRDVNEAIEWLKGI